MAKFKCKHTGCVYEWTDEQIVTDMRKHSEYEEVVVVPAPVAVEKKKKPAPPTTEGNV
jgi:hypothetical protein